MLMSRKGRLTGKEFTMNLIEGWKELMWRIKSSSSCLVFVQRRKMSSRNRLQNSLEMRTGLAAIMASSNQAMKRLAREGAMGVAITVPNTYNYVYICCCLFCDDYGDVLYNHMSLLLTNSLSMSMIIAQLGSLIHFFTITADRYNIITRHAK